MATKKSAATLIVVGLVLIVAAFTVLAPEMTTAHEYTVKTEQVQDAERVERATSLENLSQDEQQVLYDAFKNTDEFLGGAESTVRTDEPQQISQGWQVVDVKGVSLLVAIDGPKEVQVVAEGETILWKVFTSVFGLFLIMFGSDEWSMAN